MKYLSNIIRITVWGRDTATPLVTAPLVAMYVRFYIKNFLSGAKCVLRWWQLRPGGHHPSFVEGRQTLGLQVMCCLSYTPKLKWWKATLAMDSKHAVLHKRLRCTLVATDMLRDLLSMLACICSRSHTPCSQQWGHGHAAECCRLPFICTDAGMHL